MKKTIEGVVYDGNNDIILATLTSGDDPTDAAYWEENLLRREYNSFYFYIYGGSESKHNKVVYDEEFIGLINEKDEYILPCSRRDAVTWLRTYRNDLDIIHNIDTYLSFEVKAKLNKN